MADLETTLMSLNPMDFVTGMEKGFKLGSTRAEEERDKALAAIEAQKALEFTAEPSIGMRLATTEATRAQQDLSKLMSGVESEALTTARPSVVGGRVQQYKNIETAAGTRGVVLAGEAARAPSEQARATALEAEKARRLPQIVQAQTEDAEWARKKLAFERNDATAAAEVAQATRDATKALTDIKANEQYANLHPYDQAELAAKNATNPMAKAAIREQQRALAVKELGNSGGNLGAIRTWLPRVHPGADVRLNARGEIEVGMPRKRRRQGPSGEAGDIIEETVLDYTAYSTDPNDRDRYIGNYVAQLAGETRPFLNAPTRAAAATDAGAVAVTDQGGRGPAAQPNRQAAPVAAAPVAAAPAEPLVQLGGPRPEPPATGASSLPPLQEPPGTPGVRPATGAAPSPANDRVEMDEMLTRVSGLPRAAKARDPRVGELLTVIAQLRQSPGGINPDTLQKLRVLVDQVAPAARGQRPALTTEIGQAIGQNLPVNVPSMTVEDRLNRLLVPAQ